MTRIIGRKFLPAIKIDRTVSHRWTSETKNGNGSVPLTSIHPIGSNGRPAKIPMPQDSDNMLLNSNYENCLQVEGQETKWGGIGRK